MNYFVSNITAEAVIVFFLIGFSFYTAYFIISGLIALTSRSYVAAFIRAILAGSSLKAVMAQVRSVKLYEEGKTQSDILRSTLILVCGLVLTLSLYALCDGVPRLYAITFTFIGGFVVRVLLKQVVYTAAIRLIVPVAYVVFSILLSPLRLISCMKAKYAK